MALFVAQAAVGSTLSTLLPKLLEFLKHQELCNFWGVPKMLKELEKKLPKVQAVLNDAEGRILDNRGSKWMEDLKELAYDMEDVLDKMNIESLRIDQAHNLARNKVVRDFLDLNFNTKIKKKMQKIFSSLDEIVKDADNLCLKEMGGMNWMQHRLRHETSPFVDESNVYGRKKDKENIIKLLLASSCSNKYTVIVIVGMGGLGKTTLAQLVYQDKSVKDHFDWQSWACVSEDFNIAKITKELIECYDIKENYSNMSLVALQCRLQNMIKDQLCLIVLDDVWTEKEWERLAAPLSHCAYGSKILVTTRDRKIANAISNTEPYELAILEDEHCWDLFKEKAFRGFDTFAYGDLGKIGNEIVKKCKGVPLAVKVLGSILQGAVEEKWESILKSEFWQSIDREDDRIFPPLKMSYYYLPSPLKRCFEYLSLFPTDHVFEKGALVRMWVAEGFVEAKNGRLLEDIGNEYYDELQRRSLIQNDNKMHDLVHSLARLVSRNFHCRIPNISKTCIGSIRHSSFLGTHVEELDLNLLLKAKRLRTLLVVNNNPIFLWDNPKSLWGYLSKWNHLRVLVVSYACTIELPSSISNLKHLSYLQFSCSSSMTKLPDTICSLYSLQALDLSGCASLYTLPGDIGNLQSLRHINLSFTEVSNLPKSICKLSQLLTLNLSSCKSLGNIQEDTTSPLRSSMKTREKKLDFYCTSSSGLPHSTSEARITLLPDSVCKIHNLRSLYLGSCRVNLLPNEIGDLKSLRELHLEKTLILWLPDRICELQNLQVLVLRNCNNLSELPHNIGYLCKLRELLLRRTAISSLPESICKLHNLQVLEVLSCKKLTCLPNNMGELRSLRTLNIQGTGIMRPPNSIVEITGLQELGGGDADSNKLPPHFGKLIHLRTLKKHVVCKETGRGIGELKDMNNLRGSLVISNLENVCSKQEASTANLKSKKHIEELTLQWSPTLPHNNDDSLAEKDGEGELNDILEALEPHPVALTSLSFRNYNGGKFPNWMSNFFFLKSLKMESLARICQVVNVQLLSLEKLAIIKCPMLENVSMVPPKLKDVQVEDCEVLTNLSLRQSLPDRNEDFQPGIDLPHEVNSQICNCPSLKGFLQTQE